MNMHEIGPLEMQFRMIQHSTVLFMLTGLCASNNSHALNSAANINWIHWSIGDAIQDDSAFDCVVYADWTMCITQQPSTQLSC